MVSHVLVTKNTHMIHSFHGHVHETLHMSCVGKTRHTTSSISPSIQLKHSLIYHLKSLNAMHTNSNRTEVHNIVAIDPEIVEESEEMSSHWCGESLTKLCCLSGNHPFTPRAIALRIESSILSTSHERPLSSSVQNKLKRIVVSRGDYSEPNEVWDKKVSSLLKSESLAGLVTLDQCISLRSHIIRVKTTKCHHHLVRDASVLSNRYTAGDSITSLSFQFDYAPLAVLRQVYSLTHSMSKICLSNLLKNPFSPEEHKKYNLSDRDVTEIRLAMESDYYTKSDQSQQKLNAVEFEEKVQKYLLNLGIRFVTEKDIVNEQTSRIGRVEASPDILFLDDVTIDGTPVRWLDAKNYFGSHMKTVKDSLNRSCQRYLQKWGPGALVFSKSYSERLSLSDIINLDVHNMDQLVVVES